MELLREMAIFVQVVDSGGFSAAARLSGLTTSAVSRHVARLEAQLGGRLLQRTTRSLALTELGQQVYAGCSRMVSEAREVQALAGSYSARPNGLIRVSAPVVFGQVWLAPKMPSFLAQYPDVNADLTLVDRAVDLIEEGVDLAIRVAGELAPGLAARPLCPIRYMLLATPEYLQRHGQPVSPEDLLNFDCIYLTYPRFREPWLLRRGQESRQIKVPSRLTMNNSAAILAATQAHGGIGLMVDYLARAALDAGNLQVVLPDWQIEKPEAGSAFAVYVPGRHLALKVRVFIDHLTGTPAALSDSFPPRH